MHQHKQKTLEPLFTTRSGIEVKRLAEVASQYNLLVKYNKTGLVLLNGQLIDHEEYNRIVTQLEQDYPQACVYANAYQFVFVYPKPEGEAC